MGDLSSESPKVQGTVHKHPRWTGTRKSECRRCYGSGSRVRPSESQVLIVPLLQIVLATDYRSRLEREHNSEPKMLGGVGHGRMAEVEMEGFTLVVVLIPVLGTHFWRSNCTRVSFHIVCASLQPQGTNGEVLACRSTSS